MKAQEFRIGNLILYKGDVIPITMIGQYGIQSNTDKIIINAKFGTGDLEPIPITEEWLLRFGFTESKIDDTGLFSPDFKMMIEYDDHFMCYTFPYHIGERSSGYALLKYVHQLQNLYFALTGQELELKL